VWSYISKAIFDLLTSSHLSNSNRVSVCLGSSGIRSNSVFMRNNIDSQQRPMKIISKKTSKETWALRLVYELSTWEYCPELVA